MDAHARRRRARRADRPIRLIGSSIDITRHKQAEKSLRESEERFRRYFELGLIGMAITSPAKGCLEVNHECCRILGYDREELLGKTWAEMTHPDDVDADIAQFERVMARQIDGYIMDKRWIRKDGRVIDSTISVTCVRGENGSVDYFVGLLQDVTQRKRAEEALRESEEKYRRLVSLLPIAIYTCDAQGIITYYNERATEIWGCSPRIGDSTRLYSGAYKLHWPDGTSLPHDQTPMAVALREGRPCAIRKSLWSGRAVNGLMCSSTSTRFGMPQAASSGPSTPFPTPPLSSRPRQHRCRPRAARHHDPLFEHSHVGSGDA